MPDPEDAASKQEAADDAAFASGFPEAAPNPADQLPPDPEPEAPAGATEAPAAPEPEYVQVTKQDWEAVRAAAQRSASHDQQLSRAFGTIGNIQKTLNDLRAAPASGTRELPKDALAGLERDFPEIAGHMKTVLEAVPAYPGQAAAVDQAALDALLTAQTQREIEALDDAHPDWRKIVGADGTLAEPGATNPFRSWLATKDADYQARLNRTESAAVISRAIDRFERETRAAQPATTATTPRSDARAERIRGAVQPRGDGARAPTGKSDDDEFEAGFAGR